MEFLAKHWGNYEFYQIIHGYPGGFIIFALNGDILETNHRFTDILHCTENDVYNHTYTEISDNESHTIEAELLKSQAFTRGYTDLYEKKYCIGKGRKVIVRQHVFLIRNDDQQPDFLLAMIPPMGISHATASSQEPAETDLDAPREEIAFLKKQNSQLQEIIQKARADGAQNGDRVELSRLTAEYDTLSDELASAAEKTAKQESEINRLNNLLQWKDKQIEELKDACKKLEDETLKLQGELDVTKIAEALKNAPPEQPEAELPLPWEVEDIPLDDDVSNGSEAPDDNQPGKADHSPHTDAIPSLPAPEDDAELPVSDGNSQKNS